MARHRLSCRRTCLWFCSHSPSLLCYSNTMALSLSLFWFSISDVSPRIYFLLLFLLACALSQYTNCVCFICYCLQFSARFEWSVNGQEMERQAKTKLSHRFAESPFSKTQSQPSVTVWQEIVISPPPPPLHITLTPSPLPNPSTASR